MCSDLFLPTILVFHPYFHSRIRFQQSFKLTVIYKYICYSCSKSYYGVTSRNFRTRMFEHAGLSSDTGKEIKGTLTAIKQHKENSKHPVKFENFSIIDSARSDYQSHIIESLHFRFNNPDLYKQVKSETLSLVN